MVVHFLIDGDKALGLGDEGYKLSTSMDSSSLGGKVRENTLNHPRSSASISPCFLTCFRYLSPRYCCFAPTDRRKTAIKVSKQLLALSRCE